MVRPCRSQAPLFKMQPQAIGPVAGEPPFGTKGPAPPNVCRLLGVTSCEPAARARRSLSVSSGVETLDHASDHLS